MKINEIHIYGYGRLENLYINNLSQFQIFYGENEAGKSTIMSFIHSILFGFPTKQQSELRYEPKIHAKYGGKLSILHPTEGVVIIERVKGKAVGDVMVKLENGTTGGDELLSHLLRNIDKTMYQAIYSFNLSGLQNIHQVKSEDIGKFLFSTGAVGTDKLLRVENELKKELDNRFKPGGKRPILNESLKELHELHIKLKKAQQNNDAYSTIVQKRMSLEESLKTTQSEMKDIQININRISEWQNHFPAVQELIAINKELEQTNALRFPLDGLKRYEALIRLVKPLEAQLTALQDKHERLKEQLSLIVVNTEVLKHDAEVEAAIANFPLDNQYAVEESEIRVQLESIRIHIRQLKDKLYYSIDEQQLSMIDTSIFMKEKMGQAQSMFFRLSDQKQMLDRRFQEEKSSLEQMENEISSLEEQLLTEQGRDSLLQQWKQATAMDQVKLELKEIQDKVEYYRDKFENSQLVKTKGQNIVLVIGFLLLALWSGLKQEWELFFVTIASFVVLSVLYIKRTFFKRHTSRDHTLAKLIEREERLLSEISASATQNLDSQHLSFKIKEDDSLREQIKSAKLRCTQQQFRYDQVIQAYEMWEIETKSNSEAMNEVYQMLNLPIQVPREQLADAFQIITNLKDIIAEEQRLLGRLVQLEDKRRVIHSTISGLVERFISEKKASLADEVISLREMLKVAHQNNIHSETILQKIDEVQSDLITVRKEHQHISDEINQLLKEAEVESEQEFRFKAKDSQKRELQLARKLAIENQLKLAGFSTNEYQDYKQTSQLNAQIEEWNSQINGLEELIKRQLNDIAEINFQISLLEEGGTYTELLHRYKQHKYEFEEQARVWGSYAVAKQLLSKTIERYKNEKLPTLLQKAEEYLSYLTMGSYIRIHAKEEDNSGFVIERKDHTFFEPNELSQATMEQVYVSIRLALAMTIFDHDKFAIIIDDSFVNFDQKRTERILNLLSKIKGHQILFFTCHSHLLSYFSEKQIIHLERNE
jgi:uncharacterized protein YhaN